MLQIYYKIIIRIVNVAVFSFIDWLISNIKFLASKIFNWNNHKIFRTFERKLLGVSRKSCKDNNKLQSWPWILFEQTLKPDINENSWLCFYPENYLWTNIWKQLSNWIFQFFKNWFCFAKISKNTFKQTKLKSFCAF